MSFLMPFWMTSSFAAVFVDEVINLPDGQYHVKIEGRPSFIMSFNTPSGESKVVGLPQLEMYGPKIPHALYAFFSLQIQEFFDELKSELGPSLDDLLYKARAESLWFEIFHEGNLARAMAGIWFEDEEALGKNFKRRIENSPKNDKYQEIEQFYISKSGNAEQQLILSGDQVLVVTHASQLFDKEARTKSGLDQIIEHFTQQQWPVAFVMSDDQLYDFSWFSHNRSPTLAIFSRDGEHHLKLAAKKVYLAGGYFSLCLNRTLNQIANGGAAKIKIYLPMNAIYEDVYFWPTDHLRGAERVRVQAWIAQSKVTSTLLDYFKNLGARAIIEGTKTLLSMLPKKYSISIAINGKVMYSQGTHKKKIYLEFL